MGYLTTWSVAREAMAASSSSVMSMARLKTRVSEVLNALGCRDEGATLAQHRDSALRPQPRGGDRSFRLSSSSARCFSFFDRFGSVRTISILPSMNAALCLLVARQLTAETLLQPCVRPVSAVRMTAGHNALRGPDPVQKPAFDDALAHVGCPDRRIDRLCITCCSPSQPSHHAG